MKRALLLTCALAFTLAACGKQETAPTPTESASAGPEAPAGLSLGDGKLVLPAVKGRPGAAYFSVTNGSDKDAVLAAAFVDGAAKAELHETMGGKMEPLKDVPVKAGETVSFARGGKHVMLFDLDEKLVAGGTAELTLTLANGDKISAPLKIEAAGGDMGGMAH